MVLIRHSSLRGVVERFSKRVDILCYEVGRKPGFTACFADGTVRFIRSDAGEEAVRALITRNGGEKVDPARLE